MQNDCNQSRDPTQWWCSIDGLEITAFWSIKHVDDDKVTFVLLNHEGAQFASAIAHPVDSSGNISMEVSAPG